MDWVIEIGHPRAEDVNNIVAFFPTLEEVKALQRRENTRERVKRYRSSKESRRKGIIRKKNNSP
jgi:hypothetical protein